MQLRPAFFLSVLTLASCTGTTGDQLISFQATASGAADLPPGGGPLEFDSPLGFHVRLSEARVHVGAIYLNQSVPISGAQETSCILPGVYVGQVVKGRDVDILSSVPQPFPVAGEGTSVPAPAAEVWLTGGDVNAAVDDTPILVMNGEASKDEARFPFSATFTISKNRLIAPTSAALPGSHPICKQRIVTPIRADLTPIDGGTLLLRIDARPLFTNVDFSRLARDSEEPAHYLFDDSSKNAASYNLFRALQAAGAVYRFEWLPPGT
jgi:hypothetical protein